LTITQGLAGFVSENCLGRRDAADGGAAAAVVDGVAEADGDLAAPAADEADADDEADPGDEAADDGEAEPLASAEPDAAGEPVAEAEGEPGPAVEDPVPEACGAGPGVQAARADRPAPVISSRATERRVGRAPVEGSA
jgi:hypothetical protein